MPLGRAGAELEGRVLDMAVNEHLSAVDLAADIKAKGISPVEVMDDCIAAIEARNPSINAFTYTAFDEARAKAIEGRRFSCGAMPMVRSSAYPRQLRTFCPEFRVGREPRGA